MAYSTVYDLPYRVARRVEMPTIDGESVVQELGYLWIKGYRFHWMTTAELQARLALLEAEASEGWVIVGEVAREAIHEALDLYNVRVQMHKYSST